VLDRIKESGDIFFARSDDPWILSGANVHISFVGQDGGREAERQLDGRMVASITSGLHAGVDLAQARRLRENRGISFIGDVKGGSFDIDDAAANLMLQSPNPDGRSNREVVRPWMNGADITGRSRGKWIVDFPLDAPESLAALWEAPFEYVRRVVRPEREAGKPTISQWWLHLRPGHSMRAALSGRARYIATPRVAKHRLFVWLNPDTVLDCAAVAFARDDDYSFGILHSRAHELWVRATGTQLREAESGFRYTPTTCFETFPFPHPTDEQSEAIAAAARELVRLRDGWLNPPGLTEAELASRTLTNLYNQRPTWLTNAHADLDRAVLAAYVWPADLADSEILARLLALNLEREPVPSKGTPR
jgi:hypothetical protein